MVRTTDLLLTALAPMVWGSTYLVTTALLPGVHPLLVAMLRALPAGLLLLLIVRQLPWGPWWWRAALLGALNFSVFWWMLFIAAYRLPGGVAATIGALQPLIVLLLSRLVLGSPLRATAIGAAMAGLVGVAALILTPAARLDGLGIAAAAGGALAMAAGTVGSRLWQPPVPALTFTAWQLTAGGLLLLPGVLWLQPAWPALTWRPVAGLAYLGLIGAALTYLWWFRGLARLGPATVAPLGFFSPVTAVILGWAVLGQSLSGLQLAGMVLVLASVWLGQRGALSRPPARAEEQAAR